jgi:phosphate transport system substrate-binding protein
MLNNKLRSRIMGVVTASLLMVTTVGGVAVESASAAAKLSGTLKLSGSTTVQPVAEAIAADFMKKNKGVKITIAGGGSGVGINDAIAGTVNIGNSSRELKPEEIAKGLVATPICRDALVIIVNPKNKIKALKATQVADIFTGKITNWSEVGGANAPIIINSRTSPSGTLDYFAEEFLGKDATKIAKTAKAHASAALVSKSVASNVNGIGFCGLDTLKGVKGLVIDGSDPKNATKNKYKYIRFLNMCTKGKPAGLAKTFIDYCRSAAGQKIVVKLGEVKLK